MVILVIFKHLVFHIQQNIKLRFGVPKEKAIYIEIVKIFLVEKVDT